MNSNFFNRKSAKAIALSLEAVTILTLSKTTSRCRTRNSRCTKLVVLGPTLAEKSGREPKGSWNLRKNSRGIFDCTTSTTQSRLG